MSRVCEITGTRPFSGNKVSHSNIKTRTKWFPNLKTKKYVFSSLGQTLRLSLTARAIRTVDKQGGIEKAVLSAKETNLSDRLLKVRRALIKKSQRKPSKGTTSPQ